MTGLSFADLSALDQPTTPITDPRVDLQTRLPRPVVVTWATPDPGSMVGVAHALMAWRRQAPVLLDHDGRASALLGQAPAATLGVVAASAPDLRADPAQRIDAPASPVSLDASTDVGAGLADAAGLLGRTFPVIQISSLTPVSAGLADVLVVVTTWTPASVHTASTMIDQWQRAGEDVIDRVVIAAYSDGATPGMETKARRWFSQLPICPIPADPATSTPGYTWDNLRPPTQAALGRLAGTIVRLAHRQATTH